MGLRPSSTSTNTPAETHLHRRGPIIVRREGLRLRGIAMSKKKTNSWPLKTMMGSRCWMKESGSSGRCESRFVMIIIASQLSILAVVADMLGQESMSTNLVGYGNRLDKVICVYQGDSSLWLFGYHLVLSALAIGDVPYADQWLTISAMI